MSRSNNTDITNPAHRFLDWDAVSGKFQYWNKDLKENIQIEFPFQFLVLDCLWTVKGYSDNLKVGFYSNEIRNIQKEEFTVRSKNGIYSQGLWAVVKNAPGTKLTASIYIAYKHNEEWKIYNLQLKGAGLSSWIEFKNNNKIYEIGIEVKDSIEKTKGITKYKEPVFEAIETTEEENNIAKSLDIELQDYLEKYFKIRNAQQTEEVVDEAKEVIEAIKKNAEEITTDDILSEEDKSILPF